MVPEASADGMRGGEGSGVGGVYANSLSEECADRPPTPDPSPPLASLAGGGEKERSNRPQRYLAAITMISTLYCGDASLASTVARAGVFPAETQPSHTAFISGKVFMSVI